MVIQALPQETSARLAALTTVADQIRLLDGEGYPRAEIARILDKRYQHVRNVLERDAAARAPRDPVPEGSVFRLEVARNGALRLPPEVLEALGLPKGGVLSARLEAGELRLAEPVAALRRLQAMLEPLAERLRADGQSVVDELIADRRAEGAGGGTGAG